MGAHLVEDDALDHPDGVRFLDLNADEGAIVKHTTGCATGAALVLFAAVKGGRVGLDVEEDIVRRVFVWDGSCFLTLFLDRQEAVFFHVRLGRASLQHKAKD